MNILILSKTSIPATGQTIPEWHWLRTMGHNYTIRGTGAPEVLLNRYREPPDAIVAMGVGIMEETFKARQKYPDVPLYCYNWDCYEWVWKNPRPGEYDYRRYGDLLKQAREVWVPSECTGRRTTQWWGLENWKVIKSSVPYWESEDVRDEGYVLCTLREIPDPHWGLLEQACQELGLPLVMTRHEEDYETYKRKVAHCRMLVSHCYELSTGGLSLLEGYYHGKPVLLSNSEWHGGKDYFGDLVSYFRAGDLEDLKDALMFLWDRTKYPFKVDPKPWVRINYSSERMVREIVQRIEATR